MTDGDKIGLVATDLDGTLLDSAKSVPEGFFEMAAHLHARGIHVVIASGRQYFNVARKFAPVRDSLVVMADNGAYFDVYGRTIVPRYFSQAEIGRVLGLAARIPTACPIVCRAECAYLRPCPPAVAADIGRYYERIDMSDGGFEKARQGGVIKIAVHDLENSARNLWPRFRALDGDGMVVRVSGDVWLDVMPIGVDKGDGVRRLQRLLGVPPEACMAFGDFDNDLGLLSACGESYAMANAVPAVKAVCKYEAPSNDDDGVMRVLRRVFGPPPKAQGAE